MPPPPLLIRNGRVIDPATGRDERADVLLADGRVQRIERDLATDAESIDATDRIVLPPG